MAFGLDLTSPEVRVLGCLVEKQRTTPDAYPLSLNALRAACNQATNRDPVVAYDEAVIRDALHRLGRRRFTRLASGAGSRAAKYRHLLDEALGLPGDQLAVLTVLMLRGPQTPGELKARAERMHPLPSLADVGRALDGLVGRGLAERLPRRPGQKEERYAHALSAAAEPEAGAPAPAPAPGLPPTGEPAPAAPAAPAAPGPAGAPAPGPGPAGAPPPAPAGEHLAGRLAALEEEVAALRSEVAALRSELAALRDELGA